VIFSYICKTACAVFDHSYYVAVLMGCITGLPPVFQSYEIDDCLEENREDY